MRDYDRLFMTDAGSGGFRECLSGSAAAGAGARRFLLVLVARFREAREKARAMPCANVYVTLTRDGIMSSDVLRGIATYSYTFPV